MRTRTLASLIAASLALAAPALAEVSHAPAGTGPQTKDDTQVPPPSSDSTPATDSTTPPTGSTSSEVPPPPPEPQSIEPDSMGSDQQIGAPAPHAPPGSGGGTDVAPHAPAGSGDDTPPGNGGT